MRICIGCPEKSMSLRAGTLFHLVTELSLALLPCLCNWICEAVRATCCRSSCCPQHGQTMCQGPKKGKMLQGTMVSPFSMPPIHRQTYFSHIN